MSWGSGRVGTERREDPVAVAEAAAAQAERGGGGEGGERRRHRVRVRWGWCGEATERKSSEETRAGGGSARITIWANGVRLIGDERPRESLWRTPFMRNWGHIFQSNLHACHLSGFQTTMKLSSQLCTTLSFEPIEISHVVFHKLKFL